MAEPLHDTEPLAPDLSHLITEDDEPVDNRFSERQQKLLTLALFDSWEEGKPFEALSNVGLFYTPSNDKVVVPDFLLSLGVTPREVTGAQEDRCYYTWLYGKAPDLVIEVVSNRQGGELKRRFKAYERVRVTYYAVYDPFRKLGNRQLRLFQLVAGRYVEMADPCRLPALGLGLTLWDGEFLGVRARWLRFVDRQGQLVPTGAERAQREAQRAQQEAERAQQLQQTSVLKLLRSRFQALPEDLAPRLAQVRDPVQLESLFEAALTESLDDWLRRLSKD